MIGTWNHAVPPLMWWFCIDYDKYGAPYSISKILSNTLRTVCKTWHLSKNRFLSHCTLGSCSSRHYSIIRTLFKTWQRSRNRFRFDNFSLALSLTSITIGRILWRVSKDRFLFHCNARPTRAACQGYVLFLKPGISPRIGFSFIAMQDPRARRVKVSLTCNAWSDLEVSLSVSLYPSSNSAISKSVVGCSSGALF